MKTKIIEIYKYDCCEEKSRFPSGLQAFIGWLRDKWNTIPEEFRDSAQVEIEASSNYDCGELEFTISYERPETEAEEQERVASDAQRADYERRNAAAQLADIRRRYPDL